MQDGKEKTWWPAAEDAGKYIIIKLVQEYTNCGRGCGRTGLPTAGRPVARPGGGIQFGEEKCSGKKCKGYRG